MGLEERVGIVVIFLFLLLVGALFLTRDFTLRRNRIYYEVQFDGPVYLREQDPVLVLGIQKGKISGIRIEDGRVIIRFFTEKFPVPIDSKVILESGGLLGQYRILIIPGKGEIAREGFRFAGERGFNLEETLGRLAFFLDTLEVFLTKTDSAFRSFSSATYGLQMSLKELNKNLEELRFLASSLSSKELGQWSLRLSHFLENADSILNLLKDSPVLKDEGLAKRIDTLLVEVNGLVKDLRKGGIPVKVKVF